MVNGETRARSVHSPPPLSVIELPPMRATETEDAMRDPLDASLADLGDPGNS